MDTKNTEIKKPAKAKSESKKRTKKDLKDILADMSDPEKVLASPDIISAGDLMQVSYELGEYPYPEKISTKEYERKNRCFRPNY